jgi:hypothetical protein
VPGARCLQRELRRARGVGDLDRAARDARIARARGKFGVGLRRQRALPRCNAISASSIS